MVFCPGVTLHLLIGESAGHSSQSSISHTLRVFNLYSVVDLPIAMTIVFAVRTRQPQTTTHPVPITPIGLPRLSNLSARLRLNISRRLNRDEASRRLYVARQALKIKIDMSQLPPERKVQRLNPLFAKDEETPIPIPSLPQVAIDLSRHMVTTLARSSPLRNHEAQSTPSDEEDHIRDQNGIQGQNPGDDAVCQKRLPGSAVPQERSPQLNSPATATARKQQSSLRLQHLRAKLERITQRISKAQRCQDP